MIYGTTTSAPPASVSEAIIEPVNTKIYYLFFKDDNLSDTHDIGPGRKDVFLFHNANDGRQRSTCGSSSWQVISLEINMNN